MVVGWRACEIDKGENLVVFAGSGNQSFPKRFCLGILQGSGTDAVEQSEESLFEITPALFVRWYFFATGKEKGSGRLNRHFVFQLPQLSLG